MIFSSLFDKLAAKGDCSQVPERCLREGSQRGVTGAGLLPKGGLERLEPEGVI